MQSDHHLTAFFGAFLLTMSFVPLLGFVARKTKAMSHIDARRRRTHPIPLLGGVAIYLSCLLTSILTKNYFLQTLLFCGLPVVLVGTVDDFHELKARPKFLAQLLSAGLWVANLPGGTLLLEQAGLTHGLSQVLTLFWMIGITNAVNLIDGMDGVAGGVAFIVTLTLSLIATDSESAMGALLFSATALGFLFYNLPPAKIYLGDSGSGFLGFSMAAFCVALSPQGSGATAVFAPLLLLAFPEIDTILAVVRRLRNSRPIFVGDHSHLHHKLQKIGFKPKHALMIIYCAVAYSGLGTFTMWKLNSTDSFFVLSLTVLGLSGALAVVFLWDHILGERITVHTHAVVTEQLNRQNTRTGYERPFAGLFVDLSRCYHEFQHCTPDRTEAFAKEFALLVKRHFPDGLYKTAERSHVVVFFSDSQVIGYDQVNYFRGDFKNLMRSYNILGNEEDTLEDVVTHISSVRLLTHGKKSRRHPAA